MDWLVIDGVKPWDGRYEFGVKERLFTNKEWRWIKEMSGYQPLTWDTGLAGGDPDLITAFAVIALHRAGRIQPDDRRDVFDRFEDVPFGAAVTLEFGAAEDGDATRPPPPRSTGNGDFSGSGSRTSSAPPATPSGIPESATSASGPVMSTR